MDRIDGLSGVDDEDDDELNPVVVADLNVAESDDDEEAAIDTETDNDDESE